MKRFEDYVTTRTQKVKYNQNVSPSWTMCCVFVLYLSTLLVQVFP